MLRRHRVDRRLSQEQLGLNAGLSRNEIGLLERGARRPRPDTVSKLVEALDLGGGDRIAFERSEQAQATVPVEAERAAAWELYVELVTRAALWDLPPDEGVLREALDSLRALFAAVRQILQRHGPDVAVAGGDGMPSAASVALDVLNRLLHPVLARWHPLLLVHEGRRAPDVSPIEHERAWPRSADLRAALVRLRADAEPYAECLARLAGVPHLLPGSR